MHIWLPIRLASTLRGMVLVIFPSEIIMLLYLSIFDGLTCIVFCAITLLRYMEEITDSLSGDSFDSGQFSLVTYFLTSTSVTKFVMWGLNLQIGGYVDG